MYLVDGHNLIPKIDGMSLSNEDKEMELIALLQEFGRLKRKMIEVYFDKASITRAGSQKYGRVTAHFIPPNRSADDAIIQRVLAMPAKAQPVVVVSSDHRVQNGVRRTFVTILSSEQFNQDIRRVTSQATGTGKPDPDRQSAAELAEMEAMFLKRKKKK